MSENKNDISAAIFSGQELRASHGNISSSAERFFSHCYRILSNYGLSPYRPLAYLGVLFVIAFVYFYLSISLNGAFGSAAKAQILTPNDQVLYLTIISCLGPLRVLGGFDILVINTVWPQMMTWLFSSLSSLLWFFIILAIRRRFKVD